MRTRRSPRNQERLWKELGGKVERPQPITTIRTDAEIDAMFWISKTSRNLMKRDAAKARESNSDERGEGMMNAKDIQLLKQIYEFFDQIGDGAPDASYTEKQALNFSEPLRNLIRTTEEDSGAGYHITQAVSMVYEDAARAQVNALIAIAISLNTRN